MESAIATKGLTKSFGRETALRDVSLRIAAGSVFALVGANGAGKTTLLKILMNILAPTTGHATILGLPSSELRGHAFTNIGYVSENQEMPEWMTVTRFLNFVRPLYPQWDRALEASLLQRFDLPFNRRLKRLSRGMRMKAAFVSTLSYRPSLLILDEPLSGLDPLVRDQLVQVLRLLAREGMTILVSSHDLAEIEDFATHLGFLEKGTLLFAEGVPDLKARFREVSIPHQSALPGSIPSTWWQPEIRDGSLRFVLANAAPEEIAAIHQHFPAPLIPRIEPMTLREIFIALAQSKSPTSTLPSSSPLPTGGPGEAAAHKAGTP